MKNIVEVKRLNKIYGEVTALSDINFSIEAGKIYGLLGRNGAGKTTIMHIITAQLFATSGEVKVFGETPYENDRVLSQICFIKESQKYPDYFQVRDMMKVAASLFPNWDEDYAYSLIEDFQLPLNRQIKKLSRGMLSSVGIITGLASRAPLTIFDEPYLGLDAVARSLFYDRLIEDYTTHERTIILSTHLIDEVSRILEHVLIIDRGKLIVNEEAETLRGKALTVIGSSDKVETFISGKKIIQHDSLGGLVSATVLGDLDLMERQQAKSLGLEIAPISLQQLIVYLTTEKLERKAA